eukprot:gene2698-3371_t
MRLHRIEAVVDQENPASSGLLRRLGFTHEGWSLPQPRLLRPAGGGGAVNSIFLRIYGGLLVTLVLVALLGVLTFHQVNEVRADQYRESLARGTFRLMSDNLEPMTAIERRRALVLWSRLMGIPLALQDLDEDRLDSGVRNRVLRKQVLVEQTGPHAAK